MHTLRETFVEELRDMYDAEKQLVKALPKVAKAAEHEQLRTAVEEHLEQTEGHVNRLERVFEMLHEKPKGKSCKAMHGILEEGEALIKEKAGDAALISAAQKVEHYEMAGYGSLCAWAKALGQNEAAQVLKQTLDEEKATDKQLSELAEEAINIEEAKA